MADIATGLPGVWDALHTPAFSVDTQCRYIAFNSAQAAAVRSMYGTDIEVGQSMFDAMNVAEDRANAREVYDRVLSGESFSMSHWRGTGGARTQFCVVYSPIRSDSGLVTGATVVAMDTTQHALTQERAMRGSLAILGALGIPAYVLDQDFRFVAFSDALTESYLGTYGSVPRVGHSFFEGIEDPQEARDIASDFGLVLTGETVQRTDWRGPSDARRQWVVSRTPAWLDGRVEGIVTFGIDTTDHAMREKAIADAEKMVSLVNERYARLFDSMLEGFAYCRMIYDEEGRATDWEYLDANDAFTRLTGLKGVVGKRVSEILPTTMEDNPELFDVYQRVVASGVPEEFEIDFKPLGMWLRVSALRPEPGHFVAVFEDVSDRKVAEQELLESNARLEGILRDVTQAMGRVVEARDPYTRGHEVRVAKLAISLCEELGLPADQTEGVEMAALVHDIGKLCVPAEILTKPVQLTQIEFELIKEHPRAGYDMLKDIQFPWPVADMVLQHQERMDGSGYPLGLRGEEILMGARILAVADVVEAMASDRPYRPALGVDAGVAEVVSHPEKFDSQAIAACVRLAESGRISW